MTDLVEWLSEIEHRAAELYAAAAAAFSADPKFSALLQQLSREEEWHGLLLRSLVAARGNTEAGEAVITIDEKTRGNISGLLATGLKKLLAGEMSRDEMLETMAAAEFSEWNDIFLYVLHALQERGREYQAAVVEIERHKEQIVRFLASEPDGERLLETMRRLPSVSDKRILIVEKQPALARLLRNIVATVGEVAVVENAIEGLDRLENERFDVVISDIDMLTMNSLEFYARVIGRNPAMKDRFVFYAGEVLNGSREPFVGEDVPLLTKTELISQLRRAVSDIAHRSRVIH